MSSRVCMSPFYTDKGWVAAGDLWLGDAIRSANGTWGTVTALRLRGDTQVMYNLTVAEAHTFFVGDGQWLVHNECFSRELTLSDLGLEGTVQELSGSFTLNNTEAFVKIDMIEGIIKNPFSIMQNLKNTARNAGAKTLRIEAVLANEDLYTFLVRRYGMKTDPITNHEFIEIILE